MTYLVGATREFEREFARSVGAAEGVLMPSPAAALRLALQLAATPSLGEVVVPAPFWTVGIPVVMGLGATPVLADAGDVDGTVDVTAVGLALTGHTSVVVVDDTGGIPADVEAIARLCRPRGIAVIENVGEAVGAYRSGRLGSHADVAIWSLNDGPLGTGAGAVLTTDSREWAECARPLRRGPLASARELESAGFLMRTLGPSTARRREGVERLRALLDGVPSVRLRAQPSVGVGSGWRAGIELVGAPGGARDRLVRELRTRAVPVAPGWGSAGAAAPVTTSWLPVASRLQACVLSVAVDGLSDGAMQETARLLRGADRLSGIV